jgi:hypothetical protein
MGSLPLDRRATLPLCLLRMGQLGRRGQEFARTPGSRSSGVICAYSGRLGGPFAAPWHGRSRFSSQTLDATMVPE